VQQKAAAHLLCIAAWLGALLSSRVAAMPADGDHLSRWWLLWAPLSLLVACAVWVRGERSAGWSLRRFARRRAELL
jgi:putative copper export protein